MIWIHSSGENFTFVMRNINSLFCTSTTHSTAQRTVDDCTSPFECLNFAKSKPMTTILHLDASARTTRSLSRRLSQRFVEERSEEHTSELQSLMRISYAV